MLQEEEIDEQLKRILESPVFANSARSKQFLEYCVSRSRTGLGPQLKETTIALEVFMRSVDYDPKSDPIVRVHARRVREKLHLYYRTHGANDPIKIELPKGGYVPVIHSTTRTLALAQASTAPEPKIAEEPSALHVTKLDGNPRNIRPLWIGAFLLFLLVSVGSLWVMRRKSAPGVNYLHALKPIADLPDGACDASWSPDGSELAFAASVDEHSRSHIFIKSIHSGEHPRQITTGSFRENRPVWSPDGKEIAFIRLIDMSHFEIVRMNLSSGHETPVGRFISYWPITMDHPPLDWSRDGRYFLTAEQPIPGTPMRLVVVSVSDGTRRILTSPRSDSSGDVDGKFSPDGQYVAFRRGGQGDLFLVSIRGELTEAAVPLTHDTKGVRGIAWETDGRSILFGSQRGNSTALGIWRVSITGGEPTPVTEPGFDTTNPAVSNQGALIVEHREVVSELVEQTFGSQEKPTTVLPSKALDSEPAYSPDGKSVAFISTRSGWAELWLRREENPPLQITQLAGAGTIFMPTWAPDGHAIAFSVRNNGATNIFVSDLQSHSIRKLTSTRNRDIGPVYSSDSKSIFFSSNDDGTSRIWRIREDGKERPEPLFVEAILGFQVSGDGKWLYYLQAGQTYTLVRRSLVDGNTEEVFTIPGRPAFLDSQYIANNKVYLAASSDDSSEAEVYEINPDTKESKVITWLHDIAPPAAFVMPGMSVKPDGKQLIYSHKKNDKIILFSANR